MANTIYVVMGTTGEYSDRDEWPVAYFTDENEAQSMVELLTVEDSRVGREIEKSQYQDEEDLYLKYKYLPKDTWPDWWIERFRSKLDPDHRRDYTSTTYYIMNVEPGRLPDTQG